MCAKEGEGLIHDEKVDGIPMLITLMPDGDVRVKCSKLNDQLFCLGLLENAKICIIQHNMARQATNSKIEMISGDVISDLTNKKRF